MTCCSSSSDVAQTQPLPASTTTTPIERNTERVTRAARGALLTTERRGIAGTYLDLNTTRPALDLNTTRPARSDTIDRRRPAERPSRGMNEATRSRLGPLRPEDETQAPPLPPPIDLPGYMGDYSDPDDGEAVIPRREPSNSSLQNTSLPSSGPARPDGDYSHL